MSWLVILAILFLIFLMALFSSSEVAILSADQLFLKEKAEKGNKPARIILAFLKHPDQFFSLIQIGTSGTTIAIGSLTTALALHYFPGWTTAANILVAFLVILFGELIPKSIGARSSKIAVLAAPCLRLIYTLFSPAIVLLSFVSVFLIKRLGGEVSPQGPFVTEEKIQRMLKYGEEAGEVAPQEKQMIQRVFEFSETVVREVMVPRLDMICLPHTATVKEAINLILRSGHSRIPVYKERIDKIVGILYAKDLLQYWGNTSISLPEICRPVEFLPETKKVEDIFSEMRLHKVHIAIVLDEFGGLAGLVTIEDLLEELVGEIQDEYDLEEPFMQVVSPTITLFDAKLNLDEVGRCLRKEIHADGVDTLGGLVFHLLGRVPKKGEFVTYDGLELVVEEVSENRIQKVKVIRKEVPGNDSSRDKL